MEVYYWGWRDNEGNAHVQRGSGGVGRPLRLRLDLDNHSPTGFEWGYPGSGPAQLALAILADALGNDRRAVRLHQPFKARVIQHLDRNKRWMLTRHEVLDHVAVIEREHALREVP